MADNTNTLSLTLQIKDDGSVVIDNVRKKFDDMEKETARGSKTIASSLAGIKAGYVALAAGGATAIAAVSRFVDAAAEAEQVESRMAFQLEQVGYQFQEIKPYIDDFAASIHKTTTFSDEMARQGLGQMMQYTTDVEEAMNGLRLAMDMATQSGQDLHSTTRLIGMAMNGNVEVLGRWIPELRDLDSKLGDSATSAEKAEYAIRILNEKFGGAAQKDLNTYRGQVKQLAKEYDELKESIGRLFEPIAKFGVRWLGRIVKATEFLISGPQVSEEDIEKMSGIESEAKRKARQQAALAAAAKAYADDLANWKATQEQRQAMNYRFAIEEWKLKKETMALIDAEEFMTLEKAKKIGADLNQIRQVYHLKRLEQIRKEKEEEQNAMQSLAVMWGGYYNERIAKENEIISLIKASGVETTIGARFEFAGIEEQFRKIAEKAGDMLTGEEFERIREAFIEKIRGILPWAGGQWEEIIVPIGKMAGRGFGAVGTEWGVDWRWKEGIMTEEQRRIEAMRQESIRRIQAMGASLIGARPGDIISAFDQTRQKAVELQQVIDQIKNQKLQIDTSRLIEAMNQIDETKGKLIDLIGEDYKIRVGIEIIGEEQIRRIESQLAERWENRRSQLRMILPKE